MCNAVHAGEAALGNFPATAAAAAIATTGDGIALALAEVGWRKKTC